MKPLLTISAAIESAAALALLVARSIPNSDAPNSVLGIELRAGPLVLSMEARSRRAFHDGHAPVLAQGHRADGRVAAAPAGAGR